MAGLYSFAMATDDAGARPVGNLPRALTPLVGRERELSEVAGLLSRHRLVTLAGPGGSGKTRLAVEAAGERLGIVADGAWFVDLAPLTKPEQVIIATLDALETTRGGGDPAAEALHRIGLHDLLIVLDNCEHLVEPVAAIAHRILLACPNARILATSREPLGVPGEAVWRMPAMQLAVDAEDLLLEALRETPAVALFLSRGRAANSAFDLTPENREDVIRACRAVDALPLGIELAAARLSGLSVSELANRLPQGLRLLRTRRSTAPQRQRTMEATIAWSFGLLDPAEQTLLRCLAVFNGGWTLPAAEAVCGSDEVANLLQALVDQSLVVAELADDHARYRLLGLVREFALDKLRSSGEAETLGTKHCQWFRSFAEKSSNGLDGPDQGLWLDRLEADHENLRGALAWAEDYGASLRDGLRIAGELRWFWHNRGYAAEGLERSERLLACESGEHPAARASALITATSCAISVGKFSTCEARGKEAIAIARSLDDPRLLARALHALGHSLCHPGRPPGALPLLLEAQALAEMTGDRPLKVHLLHSISVVKAASGDHEGAAALIREGLALAEELGQGTAVFLMQLGDGARMRGEFAASADYLHAGLQKARSLKLRRLTGIIELNIGLLEVQRGDAVSADRHLRDALRWAQRAADPECGLTTIVAMAAASGLVGDGATAARWLDSVDRLMPDFRLSWADQPIGDLARGLACKGDDSDAALRPSPDTLAKLMHEVLTSPSCATPEPENGSQSLNGSSLTRREIEVLRLIAGGHSNQEIADELVISLNTVERHITNLYGKIHARNKADATAYALNHGHAADEEGATNR